MNFFIQTLWFYITIKRAINANIAGSPCFTIIDLLDVKPPKELLLPHILQRIIEPYNQLN